MGLRCARGASAERILNVVGKLCDRQVALMRHSRPDMTLIELLVPTIVITALVASLVPTSSTAREPSRWPETHVGELLEELESLQNARKTGSLAWEQTMRRLIELGPDAVPELVKALDATPTEDRMMLRSIPFVLRGIGDKRAIPALIRAIPRCFGPDGSDMGYRCGDRELLAFMQKHDNSKITRFFTYSYGRPRNEVFRTLMKWTGESFDWQQLAFVSASYGSPRQIQLKEQLFLENAHRWANWWKQNWNEYVDDPVLAKIELPPIVDEQPLDHHLDATKPLRRVGGPSNMLVQSVYAGESGRIFRDLDTGRWSGLPRKWYKLSREEIESSMTAIIQWASSEGFELMGTEIGDPADPTYMIQPINLRVWELPESYPRDGSVQELIHFGNSFDRPILASETEAGLSAYDNGAVFFFITAEETPGKLRLGVQIIDSNIQRETLPSDSRLDSRRQWLGRRVDLSILE